jgi:hypothetical protein
MSVGTTSAAWAAAAQESNAASKNVESRLVK